MKKRVRKADWTAPWRRQFVALTRTAAAAGTRAFTQALKPAAARQAAPAAGGRWIAGLAIGPTGARRFRLFRPAGLGVDERRPLMVMLHGCGQDARTFAASTGMNRLAVRDRFLVLYPEQDRLANGQGCWNWFDTGNGRAQAEAALILQAIDQVCLLHPVDRARVAIAGMSAGASMAAVLATRYPDHFRAVVMHSGIAPGAAHSRLTALGALQGRRPPKPHRTGPQRPAVHWPALLVIQGDRDGVVSPRNGLAAAQAWARVGDARAGPTRRVQRGQRHPMQVTDFRHHGHRVATLVTVEGLAHAWSGGAESQPFGDAHGPDASRMAWTFATRQFQVPA